MSTQQRTSLVWRGSVTAMSLALPILLGSTALFSWHTQHQKRKLNNSMKQKIKSANQEILSIKDKLNQLKVNTNYPSNKNEDEKKFLTQTDFENEVASDIAKFKHLASLKKITFPSNVFSETDPINFYSKNREKKTQYKQKQWILLKFIFENILLIPKLKIDQLELKELAHDDYDNNSSLSLGTLLITITTREDYFQKLLNSIIGSKYSFVISSINISNNNPIPPLHHCAYIKDRLLPILGSETITATLRIHLCNTAANTSSPLNQLQWKHQTNQSPLFVSRHYAVKNETLIDLIEYSQTLSPPIPNEWVVSNNLDYGNSNLIFEDLDHTGFNNLEKWQGDNPKEEPGRFSSDPNDPTSHPLLWTKLRCYQKDITSEVYSLYFLGTHSDKKFQVQPETILQSKNSHGKTTFNKKIRDVQIGEQIEGLPYKLVDYQEKRTRYKKTYYDSSELTIEHPETKQQVVLIKKSPSHPRPTQLVNITSIKLENTIFDPPQTISLKLGDCFSLDYFLPHDESKDKQNLVERETYQLIDINSNEVTLQKDSNRYKIPIITTKY